MSDTIDDEVLPLSHHR